MTDTNLLATGEADTYSTYLQLYRQTEHIHYKFSILKSSCHLISSLHWLFLIVSISIEHMVDNDLAGMSSMVGMRSPT